MPTGDLPAYDAPPVIEVAVSVQFPAIEKLDPARLGLSWQKFRGEFPEVKSQPPLVRQIERFGPPAPSKVDVEIEEIPPAPRLWFLSKDGTRLIQVQRDHFVYNWRKLDTGVAYPHYDEVRAQFLQKFETFVLFLGEEGLSAPQPDQVELTYVNHIPANDESGTRAPLERYVRLWAGLSDAGELPTPESVAFQSQFAFRRGTTPLGRLYIQVQSRIFRADTRPLYHLQLTARGAPLGEGLGGVLSFLDEAHVWIVRAFTSVTTEEMHSVWQRRQ
ncbi:MAG TPA: TIGR04255 family protein [Gemmatimonadales bacterium]